jgi:hypothetical protein
VGAGRSIRSRVKAKTPSIIATTAPAANHGYTDPPLAARVTAAKGWPLGVPEAGAGGSPEAITTGRTAASDDAVTAGLVGRGAAEGRLACVVAVLFAVRAGVAVGDGSTVYVVVVSLLMPIEISLRPRRTGPPKPGGVVVTLAMHSAPVESGCHGWG